MDENDPIEKLRKDFEEAIEQFCIMHVQNYSAGPQRLELDIMLISSLSDSLKRGGDPDALENLKRAVTNG